MNVDLCGFRVYNKYKSNIKQKIKIEMTRRNSE